MYRVLYYSWICPVSLVLSFRPAQTLISLSVLFLLFHLFYIHLLLYIHILRLLFLNQIRQHKVVDRQMRSRRRRRRGEGIKNQKKIEQCVARGMWWVIIKSTSLSVRSPAAAMPFRRYKFVLPHCLSLSLRSWVVVLSIYLFIYYSTTPPPPYCLYSAVSALLLTCCHTPPRTCFVFAGCKNSITSTQQQ